MNQYMKEAINEANKNEKTNFQNGGPFGAVIVTDNQIVAKSHNTVLQDNDPTAHAEINAIRTACKKLNTHDLSNCIIYTSCYPCPMCLAAIVWANIKEVYYANTKEDASKIGFKDNDIYKIIKSNSSEINFVQIDRKAAIKTFEEFKNNPKIY